MTADAPYSGSDDNVVQSFQLEKTALRGRIVKLGGVLDDILEPHGYPAPVSHLVSESMVLSLLLATMLKYDGIFTLQIRGDGPVQLLVSDVTSAGQLRGCASFDVERLQTAREQIGALKAEEGSRNHLAQYLGKGHMAFTVDQGPHTDRYQGIVELKGASMVDCVQHYFNQSEQITTGIKMAVGQRGNQWHAGGIMLQILPEYHSDRHSNLLNLDDDGWRRTMILLDSCTEDEFLDPDLHPNDLLTRLFHEEGVRVYEPLSVYKGCRCSQEKIENIVKSMSQEQREDLKSEGQITLRCEFCSRDFIFEPQSTAQ